MLEVGHLIFKFNGYVFLNKGGGPKRSRPHFCATLGLWVATMIIRTGTKKQNGYLSIMIISKKKKGVSFKKNDIHRKGCLVKRKKKTSK